MRLALAIAALAAAGCGDSSNRLYGSVSEIYNLTFDTVQVSQVGDFIVVDYIRSSGPQGTLGKAAKLTVNLFGIMVVAGQSIDLTSTVMGAPRGTLEQILDTTTELPFTLATITFDQVPAIGQSLAGHFRATLSMPPGRTLDGDFLAPLTSPNGADLGAGGDY